MVAYNRTKYQPWPEMYAELRKLPDGIRRAADFIPCAPGTLRQKLSGDVALPEHQREQLREFLRKEKGEVTA